MGKESCPTTGALGEIGVGFVDLKTCGVGVGVGVGVVLVVVVLLLLLLLLLFIIIIIILILIANNRSQLPASQATPRASPHG